MTIAPLRPASTVVIVRDSPTAEGFEVLMVRRNDKVAFMAGAHVFPGGRVDDEDVSQANHDAAQAHRLAAVREVQEEAGVAVDPAHLVLIAHWVTPEIETRRYDTWFFLVRMPDGQVARHDASETTEFAWLSPREATERCMRSEIMLPPPTWTTLKQMQRHHTTDDLFAWARGVAIIPRVQPQFFEEEHQSVLTLPGDPTYPTIDGWEVPEDTRFVLQDGRWRPVQL
jgi:8-oxo-dGTP pyrophosphatase MutT (NUDIX family)